MQRICFIKSFPWLKLISDSMSSAPTRRRRWCTTWTQCPRCSVWVLGTWPSTTSPSSTATSTSTFPPKLTGSTSTLRWESAAVQNFFIASPSFSHNKVADDKKANMILVLCWKRKLRTFLPIFMGHKYKTGQRDRQTYFYLDAINFVFYQP